MPRINVVIAGDASKFKKAMREVQNDMRKTATVLTTIGGQMFKTVGAPVAAIGTASVITAMKFERMEMGLKAIMGNAKAAEDELQRLTRTAQLPGVSLEQAIQGSVRLQAVGIEAGLARAAIEEFGNALAVSGGSAADLDGVILALTQMKGAGKILTQDLRQITSRIPMLAKVLKKQFGTDVPEEINKMGVSFEEFSARVIQGMRDEIPRAANTLENSFVNLKLAGEGLMSVIGKQLMKDLDIQSVVEGATTAVNNMAEAFSNLSPLVRNTIYGITGVSVILGGGLWVGGKIAFAVSNLANAFALLSPKIIGARDAMKSLMTVTNLKKLTIIGAVLGGVTWATNKLADQVGNTSTAFGRFVTKQYATNNVTRAILDTNLKLRGVYDELEDDTDDLADATSDINDAFAGLDMQFKRTTDAAVKAKAKISELGAIGTIGVDTSLRLPTTDFNKIDIGKVTPKFDTKDMVDFAEKLDLIRVKAEVFQDGMSGVSAELGLVQQRIEMLLESGVSPLDIRIQALQERFQTLQDFMNGLNIGEEFGNSLAHMATQGELSFKRLGIAAVAAAGKIIRAKLMEAVASYLADAFAKFGILGGVLAGAASGLVGGLFDAAINKIAGKGVPALAEGGMTTSAGYAMIGDNPSGKEFVIPYEKMGDFARRAMGGSNVNVSGEFRVKGTDLVLVLERQNRVTTAKRGYGING